MIFHIAIDRKIIIDIVKFTLLIKFIVERVTKINFLYLNFQLIIKNTLKRDKKYFKK